MNNFPVALLPRSIPLLIFVWASSLSALAKSVRRRNQLIAATSLLSCVHAAIAREGDIFMRTMTDGTVELSNVPVGANFELFIATPALAKTQAIAKVVAPTPSTAGARNLPFAARAEIYREMIAEAARRSNVDPQLLHAIITVESGYDPLAVSSKGAIGLMQLMPNTARRYGVENLHDPLQNLLGGASYLRDLLKLFNNDVNLALAAYNAGETAVQRNGNRIPGNRETTAYVPKVMSVYRKLHDLVI